LTSGILYVVATPIGNLADLSPRAREILNNVDVIAAEDTRHTRRLLSHFGIKTRLFALHEHNETAASAELVRSMLEGSSVALVSDAGTPLLSDPGFSLVSGAHEAGLTVSPIPGPSAFVAALSAGGIATDRFCFEGFLPSRSAARLARLHELRDECRTLVFYESVHRIGETMRDLAASLGQDRDACIARELTKLHEEVRRGTLEELERAIRDGDIQPKGEFVLLVSGAGQADSQDGESRASDVLTILLDYLPGKQAVEATTRITGGKRNDIYEVMLRLKASRPEEK
jgi:16S rRNA (cytidine1402-2'-O)-methyltransferase